MTAQPWVPRNRCEFCARPVMPNLPGKSDLWIFVGPIRGQARVVACMSWTGLKPGKVPCGVGWRRMDEPLWELISVCATCHERLTEQDRARRAHQYGNRPALA